VIEETQIGHIAIFRLVHGKANALDIELCGAIARLFADHQGSSSGAVVLTGRGQIFSAGVDLFRLLDGGPSYVREFLPALRGAIEAVFFHPKPVVVALNGHAIAGGCVLACAGDKRLMAREAGRIGVTELRVGVPFPAVAFEVMRFIAPAQSFHEMIYSGATYTPDMAAVLGLVDHVTTSDALLDKAIESAEVLARLRPEAFALTKRQSRAQVRDFLHRVGASLDLSVDALWAAPETPAMVRNYVGRTLPNPRTAEDQDG
jgi:enoyl-CoA hydratase